MPGKYLLVTAMLLCLEVQAAIDIHSHPISGRYRVPDKAVMDLGIASAKILTSGAWIYWNSQQGPDHLITSLKQTFPEGLALEHLEYNDQQVLQVWAAPEAWLPKIIIYPSPVQPEPLSWLTPSETLSLVNRETLHTVVQAFHHLTTGESSPSVKTNPASREKERHLATTLTLLKPHQSTTQTPAPTPLGWDDDEKAFVFRYDKQFSDLPTATQREIDNTLKNFPEELTIKPSPVSPVQSVSGGIHFSQGSYGPKSAGTSTAEVSPSPTPAATQTVSSDGVSCSGTSSMSTQGSNSLQPINSNSLEALPTNLLNNEQSFTLTNVRLPGNEVVTDYSHHPNFPEYMEGMTFSEAKEIQAMVNQYPNHYPMPGMAVTVEKMIEEIAEMKARKDLRDDDRQPLNNLERDVIQLKQDGKYPYRDSLILSYRFVHYKAFLDYREQVETHAKKQAATAKGVEHLDNWRQQKLSEALINAGFQRVSFYVYGSTLLQLEKICWQDMLVDNDSFQEALSSVYCSPAFGRGANTRINSFEVLVSDIPLIPCPHELDICFFNNTVGIPLWLVGFSLAEKTRADGFDMGCSAFFDHDLFHLAAVLYRSGANEAGEAENTLSSIRNLYACKDSIKSVSFAALELALFYSFHEAGFNHGFKQLFKDQEIKFDDLPPQYQNITKGQVRQAHAWLQLLGISPGDSLPALEQKVKKNEELFEPLKQKKGDNEFYPGAPEIPAFIPPLIKSIRSMADKITSAGFNYRHLIDLLCKYSMLKEIPEKTINFYQLFSCVEPDQRREAQWLICYKELDSPEKLETLLPAIHQRYCEYNQNYHQNLKKLFSVCRNTVENFLAEFIKRYPEIGQNHSHHLMCLALKLETMDSSEFNPTIPFFNTYVSYLILKDDYVEFWENQDQESPREPKPVGNCLFFGIMKEERVHIEILERISKFSTAEWTPDYKYKKAEHLRNAGYQHLF